MDEEAFANLRVIEAIVPGADHDTAGDTSVAIGTVYSDAQQSQPAISHMPEYLRSLRQRVRRILTDAGIGETKAIRDAVEEFVIHAYQ